MIHVTVSGDVQGVGFRQYVKYQARKLNIKGWVKNLDNGNVEAVLSGNREDLKTLIEFCRKGPMLARVREVKTEEIPDEIFTDFLVIK